MSSSVGPVGPVGASSSGWSRGSGPDQKRAYSVKRRQFMARNRYCTIKWDSGCTKLATHVDYRVPRGHLTDEQKLDESLWQATCRHCHQQKELHLKKAIERGLERHHWEL